MKFGKTYQAALESSSFPQEWKERAIEYKQLKKVINSIAAELEDAGLTPDVLRGLLAAHQARADAAAQSAEQSASQAGASITEKEDDDATRTPELGEGGETGIVPNGSAGTNISGLTVPLGEAPSSDSDVSSSLGGDGKGANGRKRRRKQTKPLKAEYELAGTTENPLPRIRIIVSSSSSSAASDFSASSPSSHYSSAESDLNDAASTSPSSTPSIVPPSGINDRRGRGSHRPKRFEDLEEDDDALLSRYQIRPARTEHSTSPAARRPGGSGSSDVRSLASSSRQSHDEKEKSKGSEDSSNPTDADGDIDGDDPEDADLADAEVHMDDPMIKKLYGIRLTESDQKKWGDDAVGSGPPGSPRPSTDGRKDSIGTVMADFGFKRSKSAETLKASVSDHGDEISEADGDADDESFFSIPNVGSRRPSEARPRSRRRHHHRHRREIVIPLESDTLFLSSLAHALSSLAALQLSQKASFADAVGKLANDVSRVSSPMRRGGAHDLYAWREVFSLWVEAQIFEGQAERDRGEHSVQEADRRLKWFVDQVGRRGLAKQMKHKDARDALERFLALNVQLADLKRFGDANGEATRKLLKKHDKRTALTASAEFPTFVSTTLMLDSGTQTRTTLHLPGFPSLPHLLLSSFTTTLLPVIPCIDDYDCGICGDVAFKPIRLECGHRFCVRCLAKMQKRKQDPCPMCRSPVVMRASGDNLDQALLHFLELWFPREVKAKAISDGKERQQEDLQALKGEMEIDGRCVIA